MKTLQNEVKHWYLPLLSGLLFIGIGIYTFTNPIGSYVALSFLFSMSFLMSGFFEIAFSIINRKEMDNWGWTLIFGLITAVMGILLLMHPEISLTILPLYVGFLMLFRSISAIGYSLELKNYKVKNWGYLIFLGILGIVFSILLIRNPLIAGMTVVIWTGMALITTGIFNLFLSFKLKKINAISK